MALDTAGEAARIATSMRDALRNRLRRRGYVVAVSGGIDSAVCLALSAAAVGPDRVLALLLPEKDSSDETMGRARRLVEHVGVESVEQDIEPTLAAIGCYQARDEAMHQVFPEYTPEWKSKIVLTGGLEGRYNHFRLVVQRPDGEVLSEPLGLREYLQIVAATNYKQRVRKTIEYFHADRLNYAVVGTPNRLEYDQGFFVKNGDGSADVKPIAHLYKTQVYAMARELDLPEEVCAAVPTTDTYSLAQGQDEFYFALPYAQMDVTLWAFENELSAAEAAVLAGLSEEQLARVYEDIRAKRRAAEYLHMPPLQADGKSSRTPTTKA